MYEVELKYRIGQVAQLQQQLDQIHARRHCESSQVDHYFAHPWRDFFQTDEALRVRCDGRQCWVTYKGPRIDVETKTRQEIELSLAGGPESGNEMCQLLTALGFRHVADVVKKRTTYHVPWHGATISVGLDDVERLGTFVELELAADESNWQAARQMLRSLAQRLKLATPIRDSYLEMLLQSSDPAGSSSGTPPCTH